MIGRVEVVQPMTFVYNATGVRRVDGKLTVKRHCDGLVCFEGEIDERRVEL